ncbi:VTT domain-containing protein [Patescibacteria group bacterium]|nr:VTT domain-containing protein [Patescibacteria group bacterium]
MTNYYLLTVLMFFVVSALFVNSPVPLAAALELIGGYLFGFFYGTIFNVIAMIMGSIAGYVIANSLLRDFIETHFSKSIQTIKNKISKDGLFYLMALRFAMAVPYFLINYSGGIARMKFWKFLVSSAIGVIPASIIYAYGGSVIREIGTLDELFQPKVILIIIVLVFFALMPSCIRLFRKKNGVS